MKILFSDNSLWSLIQFRGNVIRNLIAKGYDVVLVAPFEHLSDERKIEGVKYLYIPLERNKNSLMALVIYVYRLFLIYKKERPDVIFQYTIKPNLIGSIIAKILSIPSISMIAGLGYTFSNNNIKNKIINQLYSFALNLNFKVLFLNTNDFNVFRKNGFVNIDKMYLLKGGEGVDLNRYITNNKNISNESVNFLMVARILWDKGYGEYVEAAKVLLKRHSNVNFAICGYIDEDYPTGVPKSIVEENHKNSIVTYLGCVEDVRPLINNSDCIVLPSYYNEGLNRSLMEAISMSKPIITTNQQGCEELVDDGINGFLVEKMSVESLVVGIEKVVSLGKDGIVKMGIKSREIAVQKFSDNLVIDAYHNFINEVLK